MSSLLITNGTVFQAEGKKEANLFIEDGAVNVLAEELDADEVIDAKGKFIFPGFIDCHVHFREPGLEHKANMQTESRSARAGGVTTVCEMPNTAPATTSIAAFNDKAKRADAVANCDIRFYFGATELHHLDDLRTLWEGDTEARQRCCGLKLFLDHSTGDQKAEHEVVEAAFKLCAELSIPIIAHCEDPDINAAAMIRVSGTDIAMHTLHRPVASEVKAIENAISLVREYGTQFHVAHLSTGEGLEKVRKAKEEKLPVTCEVTPHHLFLDVEHYEQFGTHIKVNPPIRTKEERDALWEGIADGSVDCVSTDHAPHTLEEKQHPEPLQAPSGLPGVETMIPLLLTAASAGTLSHEKIVDLCFTKPNEIFQLGKSEIVDGSSPDIVVIDPNEHWAIHGEQLHAKCGWTPFEGAEVVGRVQYSLLAKQGYQVMKEDDVSVV